jgi:hypothetical protein
MTIAQAVTAGLAGEKLSRTLTGTDEVSAGRTAVATGSGALLGGVATGAVAVGLGVAAAPVVIPVAVVSGLIAGIRSFWE